MDDGIFPQVKHTAGWARGRGRGERNISQSGKTALAGIYFASTLKDANGQTSKGQHIMDRTSAPRQRGAGGKLRESLSTHIRSGVVMDIAAFKVSYSVGASKDATALQTARARGQAP